MDIFFNFVAIETAAKGALLCIGVVFLVMLVSCFVEASLEIRTLIEDIEELHLD